MSDAQKIFSEALIKIGIEKEVSENKNFYFNCSSVIQELFHVFTGYAPLEQDWKKFMEINENNIIKLIQMSRRDPWDGCFLDLVLESGSTTMIGFSRLAVYSFMLFRICLNKNKNYLALDDFSRNRLAIEAHNFFRDQGIVNLTEWGL